MHIRHAVRISDETPAHNVVIRLTLELFKVSLTHNKRDQSRKTGENAMIHSHALQKRRRVGGARRLGLIASLGALVAAAPAVAADLYAAKEPLAPAPVAEEFLPFFVKLGVTYVLNTSNSTLYGPLASRVVRGDVGTYPQHVGASLGNITTVGGVAGYYVTPDISLEVSGGVPQFIKITTKGYNPFNPVLKNGTMLGMGQLGLIPITVAYHFRQFGPVQPYLGVGFAPSFSFVNENGFLTNIKVGGSIGLVLQTGVDYVLDRHWAIGFDVKKVFTYAESQAAGVSLLPGVPAESVLHTRFQPWLFSAGVTYRFGLPNMAETVVAKY
jgi:outer membrane protein